MNIGSTTSGVCGARIEPLDDAACQRWFQWLLGSGEVLEDTHNVSFTLAHCDSGVTWGYLDGEQKWRLGSEVDSSLCPNLTVQSLHELRLFGRSSEVLIWRTDDGLRGRILIDDSQAIDDGDPPAPFFESRRLRGDRKESHDGFVRYVDRGGTQHLAPACFPEEFSVCHYLQENTETGAVRIVATRLVPEKKKA